MKKFHSAIYSTLVVLILAIAASCGKSRKSLWTPAGSEVDSLTAVLDSMRRTEAQEPEFSAAVSALTEAARQPAATSPAAKARALYWQAYMIERYTRMDSSGHEAFLPLLDSARQLLDSAASPYDMARLGSLRANALPPEEAIKAYLGSYDVFVDLKDYHSAAGSMFNLAYIYHHFGDYASADICYEKSIGIMERVHPLDSGKYISAWNHRAIMHRNMGDTLGAIVFARKVASMNLYDVSDKVKLTTEKLLYYDDRDIRHLRNALECAGRLGWEEDVVPVIFAHFLAYGPTDSAMYWKERTLRLPVPETEISSRITRTAALHDYYAARRPDSAAMYADTLASLTAGRNRMKNVIDGQGAIRKAILEDYIARTDKESQALKRQSWWLLATVSVCLIVIVTVIIHLILRRSRRKQHLIAASAQAAKRELIVTTLENHEKTKAIRRALSQIKESADEADTDSTTTAAARLTAALTADLTPAEEWERFKVIFAESNPGFKERLLEKHPGLTPGEYRLACLIRTSIDNKHIARLMGVSPSSVYTSRFRLRQKLALPPDTNLDIYLLRL